MSEARTFDALDDGDLATIGLIMSEPGWTILKECIEAEHRRMNSVYSISGDAFKDGKIVGRCEGISVVLSHIDILEGAVKEAGKHD